MDECFFAFSVLFLFFIATLGDEFNPLTVIRDVSVQTTESLRNRIATAQP